MKKFAHVIAALSMAAVFTSCDRMGGGDEEKYRTRKAVRGDLTLAVSASGVVEPNFQVEVKSKASGEILEFPFEPGDLVTEGQTMLRLDPKTEERNVAQKEADLTSVLAELESARADLLERKTNLDRTRKLFDKNLVSDKELDAATAAMDMARARIGEVEAAIAKAKIALEDAKERLEDTVIKAPIDGTLVEKSVEKGQIISSGITSVTGGTKLCVIADLSRLVLFAMVDETDIGRVEPGQKAVITVDAYRGREFFGVVRRIYPVGETQDNITIFRVKIEAEPDGGATLRPKMTANVDMILDKRENVVIAPEEAVREEGGESFVYVMDGGKPVKRIVKTGLSNGFETEITEGVAEGELVVLNPPK